MTVNNIEMEVLKTMKQLKDKNGVVWYWNISDALESEISDNDFAHKLDKALDSLENKGYIKRCSSDGGPIKKGQPNSEFYKIIKE